MNIRQTLEDTASEIPHKEAIVLGAQRITYGELDEASNRVANALLELGMEKGTHVAILMSHSPEWVINYFGVIKGGGVAVLLNTALKAPELDSLLLDSDSEILITEKEFSRMISSVLPHIPLLKHVIEVDADSYTRMIAKSSAVSPAIDIRDEDEGTIIYTSGVLGRQKGVVHTHASLMGTPPIVSAAIQRGKKDTIIDPARFSHLFGLCEVLLGSFIKGSTIVLIPNFTPRAVLEAVEKEKGSIIFGVPAMYNALAMMRDEVLREYNLNSLRIAVTAGAKSFPKLMENLEDKFGLSLYEVYGLTEVSAVSISTFNSRKLGTVGKPICRLKILDDGGKKVPRGEIGEAVFNAPWAMKGYYKAPKLTAQVLKDGWFYTGDLVRMDEEGYLEYVEKKSFIIVTSSGLKVGPSEVEFVLLSHPSIAEAVYVGIDDGYGGQIPTAFVVLKEGQSATSEELANLCYHNLADFKLPKRIEFIDSIPKTASGKIDRKKLKERELTQN
ncbi:AMP-binding protein [Candidatus Micrarchaeota archaeon]|nr:AMP-binding protein [Candidatus Micrarchaeota archaeon]